MNEKIKYTNLTLNKICELMEKNGCTISRYQAKQLLKKHGYVRRTMQKTGTMKQVKNRNEQFLKIKSLVSEYKKEGIPVISIDVKKKEQLGNFYRDGDFYGTCKLEVYDHDFSSFGSGVIIPHGIYDMVRNEGYITIGTSKDTSEFSCDNIEKWWNDVGVYHYPNATEILILADGGGSNSSSHYIFKQDLQNLAIKLGLSIRMAHYPPYTSKYNPIEHRLFPHVTRACKGVVFSSVELVAALMSKTSTKTGLKVIVDINEKIYQTGRKIFDGFKQNMKISFDDFLGKWNYMAFSAS
jgi:hypothetical protein